MNALRITRWTSASVVVGSLIACVIMAVYRSIGLTAVTVTAINPGAEPVDHNVPFVKRHEALPDYELVVLDKKGRLENYLGTKPDESAVNGLEWRLSAPISVAEIAAVRLREKDAVVSDAIAEVHVQGDQVESNGYRFDFETERSWEIGVKSFFDTPIGMAISAAFFLAVLLLLLSAFAF